VDGRWFVFIEPIIKTVQWVSANGCERLIFRKRLGTSCCVFDSFEQIRLSSSNLPENLVSRMCRDPSINAEVPDAECKQDGTSDGPND
jgi:hypothetical protein